MSESQNVTQKCLITQLIQINQIHQEAEISVKLVNCSVD